jgi:diadenosine tetraphosphate (Ap4A) HIT family hydrolase/5-methylcytosine-specific restriction endonuclease McrA
MRYAELKDFIARRMRMSHIYQPVMLIALLRHAGKCTTNQIARAILRYDDSQVEYYEQITNNMVGRVLRNHGIVDKLGTTYVLRDSERLTPAQREDLIDLCRQRLDGYMEKRGDRIFQHRTLAAGYVSGTLRYEVLRAAKFRCELCGVPADEKALEVDHILPRNHGGTDDPSNLQALCYSCNSMKRDRDSTDFHSVRQSYDVHPTECLFCNIPTKRIVAENALAYTVEDGYPVTPNHSLVIPRRHVPEYFDLGRPEVNACNALLTEMRKRIKEVDATVMGFNIGMNCGAVAGQTIFHCHIHLIPRRAGDVEKARGGIRHIIPGKGDY